MIKSVQSRYRLKAVIDIGSTAIRMVIAESREDGSHRSLETLTQGVAIGADTFTRGKISRGIIAECVRILRNYAALLKEYDIDPRTAVRAVATSAVREARNRDEFIDRVYMSTDIDVEIIEGTEVNRLTFLAIQPALNARAAFRENRLLVAEVGGGSTELLGLDHGRVSFAHTYRMGAYRLRETMEARRGSAERKRETLSSEIDATVRQCREAVGRDRKGLSLLLLGGEARFAARAILKEWNTAEIAVVKLSALAKLAEKILSLDVEQVMRKHRLTSEQGATLGPALLAYTRMAQEFGLKQLHVCGASLRDGLLAESASGEGWSDDFVEQILHSVGEVGRKFHYDERHADNVTALSIALFRGLRAEHRLGARYEVILSVAAKLHDVGMFIGGASHHKHAKYIIDNSDIFGLGREDLNIVSLVARYHRGADPRAGHSGYDELSRENRLIVNKLAAILRAADALDRAHEQSIREISVIVKDDHVVLETTRSGDFTSEKRALAGKGELFEQVYGRAIRLVGKSR